MGQSTKQQEYFDKICGHIRRISAEKGETVSEQEILVAARNWLGFCEKLVEIKSEEKIRPNS